MGLLRSLSLHILKAKWTQDLAAAVTAATAATIFAGFSPFQAVEATTEDARVAHLMQPAPLHPDIVIVGLSEATLDQFRYRSPIDRAFLARLVDRIAAEGPRVIGLDVMFDRASEPAADRALLESLRRHGDRVVLAAPPADGLSVTRRTFWAPYRDAAISADGALILSRRDRTVRTQIPLGPQGPTFAARIAARAGAQIPQGELIIPFRQSTDESDAWPFRTYEAQHALAVPPALGWFKDKIVLVGAVLDDEDRFATPLRIVADGPDTLPGVAIHAYQVAQLTDGQELRRAPLFLAILLTALMAALGVALGAFFLDWGMLTLVIAGAALLHLVTAFALFSFSSVLWPVTAPALALMFGGAGGAALSARRNAQNRRRLDQAFRHYLAPQVVDEIMRRPDQFKIDGEERELTILVTDIEGFTAMLGEGDTRVLTHAFNQYFDGLIEAVIAHGGAVDKIVGDGLLAMFGAPATLLDHAERAVRCALAIDALCEDFRKARADIGFGRTRIGVSTGRALVGSFGGVRRINYTAYGPVVNLADRLQSANKALGTRILISATTHAQAPDASTRPVGRLVLRGIGGAETVHEPLTDEGRRAEYCAAYAALENGSSAARSLFEALRRSHPDDRLAGFHASRLARGEHGVEIDLGSP